MLFHLRNNQALASIGRPAVLHGTVHMSHDVHVRVLHGDNSGIPGGDAETRDSPISGTLSTNSGIPGGDAETRNNPGILTLIPGYREETLKSGIIPGNPVYLAGMKTIA